MTNLRLTNGAQIADTFENIVFQTRTKALDFATKEMGWEDDSIIENTHAISVKTVSSEHVNATLSCMYVDSGSVDYIYYIDNK